MRTPPTWSHARLAAAREESISSHIPRNNLIYQPCRRWYYEKRRIRRSTVPAKRQCWPASLPQSADRHSCQIQNTDHMNQRSQARDDPAPEQNLPAAPGTERHEHLDIGCSRQAPSKKGKQPNKCNRDANYCAGYRYTKWIMPGRHRRETAYQPGNYQGIGNTPITEIADSHRHRPSQEKPDAQKQNHPDSRRTRQRSAGARTATRTTADWQRCSLI